jgi:hypothetical protein
MMPSPEQAPEVGSEVLKYWGLWMCGLTDARIDIQEKRFELESDAEAE